MSVWSKLWSFLLKNWKTTLGGILVAIATLLWQSGVIDATTFGVIQSILVALGFAVAKDGDKTGV